MGPDVIIITITFRAGFILIRGKRTHRSGGLARVTQGGAETELQPWLSAHDLWGFSVECALGWLRDVREDTWIPR